jgi:hypothetical protein
MFFPIRHIRRPIVASGIAVAVVLALGSVAFALGKAGIGGQGAQVSGPNTTRVIPATWPGGYRTLGDLRRDADAVVVGRIAGVEKSYAGERGIPFTDFTFTVDQVIADPKGLVSGDSVLLHQTGQESNGTVVQVEDDPLFKAGERSVLFLRQYSPGKFFVLSGPYGRFTVEGDVVQPASPAHIPDFAGSMNLQDFVKAVRGA